MASPTSTDEEVVLNFEASRQRTEIENLQSQLEAAKAAVTRAEDLVKEKTQLERTNSGTAKGTRTKYL